MDASSCTIVPVGICRQRGNVGGTGGLLRFPRGGSFRTCERRVVLEPQKGA